MQPPHLSASYARSHASRCASASRAFPPSSSLSMSMASSPAIAAASGGTMERCRSQEPYVEDTTLDVMSETTTTVPASACDECEAWRCIKLSVR